MKTNELTIQVTGEVAHPNDGAVPVPPETRVEQGGVGKAAAPWLTVSFKAKRSNGFAKSEEWNITLDEASAEFAQADGGERIEVARE
jgi:hypothetical protein